MADLLNLTYPEYELYSGSVIHSLDGGDSQQLHRDLPWKRRELYPPLSVVLFVDGGRIDVQKGIVCKDGPALKV